MYINNMNYIKLLREKEIWIYGARKDGLDTKHRLSFFELNVEGFLDNDKSKWGRDIEGAPVFSLKEYMGKTNGNEFIIVSMVNSYDVLEQLSSCGIYNFTDYRQLDIIMGGDSFYNEEYFSWQKKYAEIDSGIDAAFFQKYVRQDDYVAEFGSGGGFLLDKIKCKSKIGVEINSIARTFARDTFKIQSVENSEEIENGVIDVVISTHALEHTTNPYGIICTLHKKLKTKGKIVLVVPYEPLSYGYSREDVSQHLYIWNERVLGNLVKSAGFFVRETGKFGVDYPGLRNALNEYGERLFCEITNVRSSLSGYYSVFVVGEKY